MSKRSEGIFDVARRQARVDELGQKRLVPGYWDDPNSARDVEKEIAAEKNWIDAWGSLKGLAEDVETLMELAEEEEGDLEAEIQDESTRLADHLDRLELRNMLNGEDDHRKRFRAPRR